MLTDLHLGDAWHVVRRTGLLDHRAAVVLALYYLLTIVNAVLDGLGIVLLVGLLTGQLDRSTSPVVELPIAWLRLRGHTGDNSVVALVIGLFTARILVYATILALDGAMIAHVRRRIQERTVTALLHGQWESLRGMRTGSALAAVTEEATLVTRYLTSAVKAVFFALGALVLGTVAVLVDWRLTLALAGIGLPCALLLRWTFAVMARLSKRQTAARQDFAADVSERLNSLLHVKVSGDVAAYLRSGLRRQRELAALEIAIGACQAVVGNFNALLVVAALAAFHAWHVLSGTSSAASLQLLVGIGAVGARATTQVNGAITLLGNLSRFAACLLPVRRLLDTPREASRHPIGTGLTAVDIEGVGYAIDGREILRAVTATSAIGRPLALRGPSGSGKTTLANVVAGLLPPSAGRVVYRDGDDRRLDAAQHSIRVGYVTQDVFLFHGSVRENLDMGGHRSEAALWEALAAAGADGFVRRLGGLEAGVAEAGRSLSGGEKRRLGIARALANEPDLLILDEITAGLDPERRDDIVALVDRLSARIVTIAVTHDEAAFAAWTTLTLESAGPGAETVRSA
jgi:ABC-type multidrug transport system fused ATPase/permease subunit